MRMSAHPAVALEPVVGKRRENPDNLK